jgi:hypothetical protein
MLRRVVIGAAVACLMAGTAYAQDAVPEEMAEDSECAQQLTSTQEIVQDKVDSDAISEAEVEKVYELLDEADALCTEGNGAEASERLATVNKMVARGN